MEYQIENPEPSSRSRSIKKRKKKKKGVSKTEKEKKEYKSLNRKHEVGQNEGELWSKGGSKSKNGSNGKVVTLTQNRKKKITFKRQKTKCQTFHSGFLKSGKKTYNICANI